MKHDEFRGAMTRTEQVIDTLLQTQRTTLIQQAKLVGELPILTAVVESGDIATMRDSAQTYQTQLQVPLLDVFDTAGSVLVSLHDAAEEITTVASADLIEAALKGQAQAGLLWRGQRLALVATAPLGLPDAPSGVLQVGQYLDEALASRILQLTNTEVSFVREQRVVSSSLSSLARPPLQAALSALLPPEATAEHVQRWETFLVKARSLRDAQNQPVGHVVLQVSRTAAEAVLAKLQRLFGGVAIVGFVVAVVLISWIARGIARPLAQMATVASRIAQGDLTQRIDHQSRDEQG